MVFKNTWLIFKDKRYDSDMQVCRQCDKYVHHGDNLGWCTFDNTLCSPHNLEWAIVFKDIQCKGFKFKEAT